LNPSVPEISLADFVARQGALKRITQAMARQVELDPQPVFAVALKEVSLALGGPMACLHLYDSETEALRLVASHGLDPVWSRAWSRLSAQGSTPPVLTQRTGLSHALAGERAPAGLSAVVSAPVRGAELTMGTLSVLWPPGQGHPPADDCADFLETAGGLLGLAIEHAGLFTELMDNLDEVSKLQAQAERKNLELAELNQKLALLSVTDGLTGLYNRRHFLERLEEELHRSRRLGLPLCLVMADLDYFKSVNDQLGHQAGDQALSEFAAHLREGVRQVDLVGRYGGEEFALALVNCDLGTGMMVAEKLRSSLRAKTNHPPLSELGGITVSMGVAQLVPGMGVRELIATADRALYLAKQNGRDRVECLGSLSV
jgi:diguanylate cyclase (GGDEF)-like protein